MGSFSNLKFALISIGYMFTIAFLYFFGSKIKNVAMNIGYVWTSKWASFVIFLFIVGIYTPEIFLLAMTMFVVFNLSLNPSIFMKKEVI